MPKTGNHSSGIAFDKQETEMFITVWQINDKINSTRNYIDYNSATHRLTIKEVKKIRQECDKVLKASSLRGLKEPSLSNYDI